MTKYLKSISGAVVAGGTAALTALQDGKITAAEWVTIAIAFFGALGVVYAVPNSEPAGVPEQPAQDAYPDQVDHDSDLPDTAAPA